MGEPPWGGAKGRAGGHKPGWRKDDPNAQSALRNFLAGGEKSRFVAKFPDPVAGDRFGHLTTTGVIVRGAAERKIEVVCSCGRGPYLVSFSSLRNGASTRCAPCGLKAGGARRSLRYGYAAIVPDRAHRDRLLSRISAAIRRCTNPDDSNYSAYGGRGIRVHEIFAEDRVCFLAYLACLPGWDNPDLGMDRVDVNRGYEPGNIRFISPGDNRRNKRKLSDLEQRVRELEQRLRHCTCGASQQVHDPHE